MTKQLLTPVIMCGGSGTRLWPVSTAAKPKQLHAFGEQRSLLQATLERVADRTRFTPPIIVTGEALAAEVERQLGEQGEEVRAIIVEPAARNTAAALALAALEADPEDMLLAMPSDHLIRREDAFLTALKPAVDVAQLGYLVTFGIEPERAETGYGYIKRGAEIRPGVYAVDRFVEKPDHATASRFLQEGGYDWNGGIFLVRAARLLQALERHAPAVLGPVRQSMATASRDGFRVHPEPASFASAPSQSVDCAVVEHEPQVAVVPVSMGWSDVGSWDALFELLEKDPSGNVTAGAVLNIDTRNCLLRADGPRLVAIGVEDVIVVATGDAVIVLPRGQSQRLREAVAALQKDGGFGC